MSALRMHHLQRIDEIADMWVAPNDGIYSVQISSIICVSPYTPDALFLFFGARYFPLLAARLERAFAHESDNSVRALDSSANTIFPIVIVWLLDRHIDEFIRYPGMKGLPFRKMRLRFISDAKRKKNNFFFSQLFFLGL